MILLLALILPAAGGLLAWLAARRSAGAARWVSIVSLAAPLIAVATLWPAPQREGRWLAELSVPWVPSLGIRFHLAIDGLGLLMVLLTLFLGLVAVAVSWREITRRVGFFHFNVLLSIAALVGVFTAVDLFLFVFFWEAMLVPMYLLIGVWGHGDRVRAAIRFVLFTQAGGLALLVAVVGLAALGAGASGVWNFDYETLLRATLSPTSAGWLFAGFLLAFAVKLPALPLHGWLPDAHTQAPTAGSVILAGLLLKTGAYGLLRFAVPLFPAAARAAAPWLMGLGVLGILYGAALAFAQTDLKRLVAYTSVSHMGWVLLGAFAGTEAALQGAVLQMICHGLGSGGLFALVGIVQERCGTRDLRELGGLWAHAPRASAFGTLLAMAAVGLPGLGSFVAEWLVLVGTWSVSPGLAIAAAVGLVASVPYALRVVGETFAGPVARHPIADLSWREVAVLGTLTALLLVIGLAPQPTLDVARPSLHSLGSTAALARGEPW